MDEELVAMPPSATPCSVASGLMRCSLLPVSFPSRKKDEWHSPRSGRSSAGCVRALWAAHGRSHWLVWAAKAGLAANTVLRPCVGFGPVSTQRRTQGRARAIASRLSRVGSHTQPTHRDAEFDFAKTGRASSQRSAGLETLPVCARVGRDECSSTHGPKSVYHAKLNAAEGFPLLPLSYSARLEASASLSARAQPTPSNGASL
ncbi:hypothetical protein C8Q73DRAFT_33670 [Cubamyces lactineus]|nr:hypothetical protein C8Q73DRAFT_33670 [Cubamyces lactineus]